MRNIETGLIVKQVEYWSRWNSEAGGIVKQVEYWSKWNSEEQAEYEAGWILKQVE